ncbi:TatD family hydrolase, partial [Acinetobacter baumannii]
AEQIIDMHFLLGIGGVLTYKKSGLEETLQHIDLSHIVLETDSPYLTPVPFRGQRNESAYIKIIAEKLASIKNVSVEKVKNITSM